MCTHKGRRGTHHQSTHMHAHALSLFLTHIYTLMLYRTFLQVLDVQGPPDAEPHEKDPRTHDNDARTHENDARTHGIDARTCENDARIHENGARSCEIDARNHENNTQTHENRARTHEHHSDFDETPGRVSEEGLGGERGGGERHIQREGAVEFRIENEHNVARGGGWGVSPHYVEDHVHAGKIVQVCACVCVCVCACVCVCGFFHSV